MAEAKKTTRKKTTRAKGGRPTVFTEEVIEKLQFAFSNDFNDREASFYAGINPSTLSRKLNEDEEFFNKMQPFKAKTRQKAKMVISGALNAGDVRTAQWYAEHRMNDEYSDKTINDVNSKVDATVAVTPFDGMSKEEIRELLHGE